MEGHTDSDIKIIKRNERNSMINALVFFVLALFCVIGWALVPVMEHNTVGNRRTLPLPAWYPIDQTLSPAYELFYFHQVFAIELAACSNTCLDSLAGNLMALSTCELELLANRLQKIAKDQQTYNTLSTLEHIGEQYDYQKLKSNMERRLYKELRECIIYHEEIYEKARILQRCIGPVAFAQFSVSALILCASLYQLAMANYNTN
ncbi:odorant receptor Or1-like [Ctenocephalides felis]|uniref:odorant receptor Or1-like n=1 Tax=Ctenocephalides felis TaxID=7515 RepID=UPI000E6E1611|nr:odorant receptor Or1-like [Ctenocephalides felis]